MCVFWMQVLFYVRVRPGNIFKLSHVYYKIYTQSIRIFQLNVENFVPVLHPKASQLIANYDEHVLVTNFKFGVLYQQFGQMDEEELFCNNVTTPAFDDFLSLLGQRIQLKDHKGWVTLFILNSSVARSNFQLLLNNLGFKTLDISF